MLFPSPPGRKLSFDLFGSEMKCFPFYDLYFCWFLLYWDIVAMEIFVGIVGKFRNFFRKLTRKSTNVETATTEKANPHESTTNNLLALHSTSFIISQVRIRLVFDIFSNFSPIFLSYNMKFNLQFYWYFTINKCWDAEQWTRMYCAMLCEEMELQQAKVLQKHISLKFICNIERFWLFIAFIESEVFNLVNNEKTLKRFLVHRHCLFTVGVL